MSGIATAIAVTGIGGALLSSSAQKGATETATAAQVQSGREAIAEQRRQFDKLQELLKPYVEAGAGALGGQEALLGLAGPEAQQEAIAALEGSPMFASLVGQGEEAILQNAAATGNLRGGNVQRSLAEFRPDVLSRLIESQFAKLGGLSSMGQASAAGVGAGGMQSGANISNILTEQGRAIAEGAMGRGTTTASTIGDITKSLGTFLGSEAF